MKGTAKGPRTNFSSLQTANLFQQAPIHNHPPDMAVFGHKALAPGSKAVQRNLPKTKNPNPLQFCMQGN